MTQGPKTTSTTYPETTSPRALSKPARALRWVALSRGWIWIVGVVGALGTAFFAFYLNRRGSRRAALDIVAARAEKTTQKRIDNKKARIQSLDAENRRDRKKISTLQAGIHKDRAKLRAKLAKQPRSAQDLSERLSKIRI